MHGITVVCQSSIFVMLCISLVYTALTVTNVAKVLETIKWRILCRILDIANSKRVELEVSFPDIEECREKAIRWWITTDPLASWRRIVDHLYRWGSTDEKAIGDRISHYSEELTGMLIDTNRYRE